MMMLMSSSIMKTVVFVATTAMFMGLASGQQQQSTTTTSSLSSYVIDPSVVVVDYIDDNNEQQLRGFLSLPKNANQSNSSSASASLPAIIIIPDWDGVNLYEQVRATLIAQELGYIGFAADIYGVEYFGPDDGLQTVSNMTERIQLATYYRSENPQVFAQRIKAAVEQVQSMPQVDPEKIALVGYCFGGTGVLQYTMLGYATDVAAVVSFHGGLEPVLELDATNTTTTTTTTTTAGPKLLILSGGEDDASSDVVALENALNAAANISSWEITRYSDIEHAFTVFDDERYNEWVDQRSWSSMYRFLQETFGELQLVSNEPSGITTEPVQYSDVDGADLLGHLAMPGSQWQRPLSAIVILPDWDGVNNYEKLRASLFAEMGYVAFAADIYGADKQEVEGDDRGVESSIYNSNSTLFVQRIAAAVDYVKGLDDVDENQVAIAGYCFGGSGIVHYGFSGRDDVKLLVAFHGSLLTLPPVSGNVTPYMLFLSGGDDFLHGNQTVLEETLDEAGARWEVTRYSSVVHGFTDWSSSSYNLVADARSLESMQDAMVRFFPVPVVDETTKTNDPSSTAVRLVGRIVAIIATALGVFLVW